MSRENNPADEMRDEYDFRPGGGVRGKYYERFHEGVMFTVTITSPIFSVPSGGVNPLKDVRFSREFPEQTLPSQHAPVEERAQATNAR